MVNSCESKSYALQTNVKERDSFWLTGQPYSVSEMMAHDGLAKDFIGGTVYQAFLSATSYHRWHSPVDGKIVKKWIVNGTYFSEPTITGFTNPDGPDPAAPDQGQGYITHPATRAIFLIQAPPPIGLMAAIYVGMADVSTCEIRPNLPENIKKGEETGMFHHGGSTHCLLFRPGVNLSRVSAASPGVSKRNTPLRSELADVYQ